MQPKTPKKTNPKSYDDLPDKDQRTNERTKMSESKKADEVILRDQFDWDDWNFQLRIQATTKSLWRHIEKGETLIAPPVKPSLANLPIRVHTPPAQRGRRGRSLGAGSSSSRTASQQLTDPPDDSPANQDVVGSEGSTSVDW